MKLEVGLFRNTDSFMHDWRAFWTLANENWVHCIWFSACHSIPYKAPRFFCILHYWEIHINWILRSRKPPRVPLFRLIEKLFNDTAKGDDQIVICCVINSALFMATSLCNQFDCWSWAFFSGFYQTCFALKVLSDHSRQGGVVQIPSFEQEPPAHVTFSNNTGAHITCAAHGNPIPSITWLTKDGSIVDTVPGLRFVKSFSLLFWETWHS